jgi:pentatricopeptide repeat protein
MSILLLSRLVKEQNLGNTSVSSDFLDWQIIDRLVENWESVHDTIKEKNSDNDVILPAQLLVKLDYLCNESPSLELSGSSLQVILGVASRRAKRLKSVTEAAFAETVLDRMTELNQPNASSLGSFHPRTKALNKVLSSWTACARPDRARALLERVQNVIPLDIRSYNCLLAAYAKVGNGEAAEQLLKDMCEQWQLQEGYPLLDWKGSAPKPDVVSWNTVISAWARSHTSNAAERVQSLLARMFDPKICPPVQADVKTFNTVLSCWARAGQADRCLTLLQEMKELHSRGELETPPDLFSYATVTNAFAKASQPEKAQDLVDEVYSLFMDGRKDLKPSLTLLTTLMDAWSRAGNVDRTRLLFQRIKDLYNFGFLDSGPDTATYNVMLASLFYANNGAVNAGEEADSLLQEMKRSTKSLPDFYSYTMLIQIFLLQSDGLHRATELVWEAIELCRENAFGQQPEHMQLKAILLAFAKADQPQVAHDVLMRICTLAKDKQFGRVRIDLFGLVFSAWDRSYVRDAALKADELVQILLNLHRAGLAPPPDAQIYDAVLSCWARSSLPTAAERAYSLVMSMRTHRLRQGKSPDFNAILCDRVLNLFQRQHRADYAYDLLLMMYEDFVKKRSAVVPRIGRYKSVMRQIAHSKEDYRVEKVEALLRNMHSIGLIPDVDAFNSLIYSFLTSDNVDATARIQGLVEEMKALDARGIKHVFPNCTSFEFWMKAELKNGAISQAGLILLDLWTMYNEGRIQEKPESNFFDEVVKSLSEAGYENVVRLIDTQRGSNLPNAAM